jgi:hypothetical protein
MVLIAQAFQLGAQPCIEAIRHTFGSRHTQPIPQKLPLPPESWAITYPPLAESVALDPDIKAGHAFAAALFDPLLASEVDGTQTWQPDTREWR